jgi:hypothetical protein
MRAPWLHAVIVPLFQMAASLAGNAVFATFEFALSPALLVAVTT